MPARPVYAPHAESVPPHLRLRVVITTDHGRLLSDSERLHPVPAGMTSHQRAAWGHYDGRFAASGVILEPGEQVAYLNGPRFNVSEHCAVVVTDASFQANDGRAGTDHFAHGGLFPEEVIIPWVEMLRDAEPPAVTCTASGRAREGREGEITLQFTNPSQIELQLLSVTFVWGKRPPQEISIDHRLPALGQKTVTSTISSWPSKPDILAGRGTARLSCRQAMSSQPR